MQLRPRHFVLCALCSLAVVSVAAIVSRMRLLAVQIAEPTGAHATHPSVQEQPGSLTLKETEDVLQMWSAVPESLPSCAIVVARFREAFDRTFKGCEALCNELIIVDKSYHALSANERRFINQQGVRLHWLPNIGREAHSYLDYIISNYDRLPDFVVFLQANPNDHYKHFSCDHVAGALPKSHEEAVMARQRGMTPLNFGSDPISSIRNLATLTGEATLQNCFEKMVPMMWADWPEVYETIPFIKGAQFVVSKERIWNHSRPFYSQMLAFSTLDVGPYVLERLWMLLFDGEHTISSSFNDNSRLPLECYDTFLVKGAAKIKVAHAMYSACSETEPTNVTLNDCIYHAATMLSLLRVPRAKEMKSRYAGITNRPYL